MNCEHKWRHIGTRYTGSSWIGGACYSSGEYEHEFQCDKCHRSFQMTTYYNELPSNNEINEKGKYI